MPALPTRHFLGWQNPPLEEAARWLEQRFGEDMGNVVVALPGTRAGLRLQELLARHLPPSWTPPRILTQGQLIDEVVLLERPLAGRLVRTLAWERALSRLTTRELESLVRERDQLEGFPQRLRLAENLRSLHGDLAAWGIDFARLGRSEATHHPPSEVERWKVLARVQNTWRSLLAEGELDDPHEARSRAIEEGRLDRTREIVLIGVADMNHLLRRMLEEVAELASVLVIAPPELAEGFDEFGHLDPVFWSARDIPLALDKWHVAERPVDQADRLLEVLAAWGERFAAEEVAVGIPDEEVVPYLERRLAESDLSSRNAAGTPMRRTRPFRLLRSALRFVEHRSFPAFAELVRHPDLACVLETGQGLFAKDPALALDAYQREHLPALADGRWIDDKKHTPGVRAVFDTLLDTLGPLGEQDRRPLETWASATQGFLLRVYGDVEIDPEVEPSRILGGALQHCVTALEELTRVPQPLASVEHTAAEALDVLLRHLRSSSVSAAPDHGDDPTIELMGWLELFLDDTPAVALTGFNEGRVPASVQGDPFLPDSARKRLGLTNNETRVARDAYAASVLLHTRQEVAFFSGRRSLEGDPLQPSRLAFHAPREEITGRVRNFVSAGGDRGGASFGTSAVESVDLPRAPHTPNVEHMSVSAFRRYLESPYGFYLENVLRLRTFDDGAREMDPLRFGILAHDVFEDFGHGELRDSSDAAAIESFLRERVDARIRATFGRRPLPAVALQGEQLKFRLGHFAQRQAERVQAGWRIVHVEWTADDGALLVDGEPMPIRGRIDRIDHHPTRGWAILDYKTREEPKAPESVHRRRDGTWVDLQLPLYAHLAAHVVGEEPMQLGYVSLGKDERGIDFHIVHDWSPADLEEALECARDVVRAVRRGEFFEPGTRRPYEEILRAIYGDGLWSGGVE